MSLGVMCVPPANSCVADASRQGAKNVWISDSLGHSTVSTSASSGSDEDIVALPSRAVKRQRARERRRVGKAERAKTDSQIVEGSMLTYAMEPASPSPASYAVEPQSASIAWDAVAASPSKGFSVVVKHTFIEVEVEDDFDGEIVLSQKVTLLPAASFFKTTAEFDQWRLAYRKFRLGHHRGAKGEPTL